MAIITIDGKKYEVEDGLTIIQACEKVGIEIPRFCYHEKLKVAGNCRMCLVEVEKTPKPQASCAYPVMDGMVVHTNTAKIKKAREGVMEFLLINHPLDCPICDQGGECDLQDQSYAYGCGESRFTENKRSVKEKDFGPLIKTFMTRCIHCTRCIRFTEQIAGVHELGATGRGEDMEVGTYIQKSLTSELSGNIIDLCPVGALTSKPYAFTARSWELKHTESIDISDAVGSNIRIDTRQKEVMRILPRLNENINEEWISDKARFAYDGLKMQRLDSAYLRRHKRLVKVSYNEAITHVAQKLKKIKAEEIASIAGDLADLETCFALKMLMKKFKSKNYDCRTHGEKFITDNRASYLFNTTIAGIEEADFCLIIGANPRHDATMVNTRLRKKFLLGNFKVVNIGNPLDLSFPVEELGPNLALIDNILAGKHEVVKLLKLSKKPMLILGEDVIACQDGELIIKKAMQIADKYKMIQKDFNGFNVLNKSAGRVGALEIGFTPEENGLDIEQMITASQNGKLKALIMLGGDEINYDDLGKALKIYIGHHGDKIASQADVILPAAAYTEKNATYINLEGRVQRTKKAVFAPGEAKEDYLIIADIAEAMKIDLGYKNLSEIRKLLAKKYEHLIDVGNILPAKWHKPSSEKLPSFDSNIKSTSYNYYMTNVICRASLTMAKCSKEFVENNKNKVA